MPLISDQNSLKIILLLGGTLAVITGAFAGMGTLNPPPTIAIPHAPSAEIQPRNTQAIQAGHPAHLPRPMTRELKQYNFQPDLAGRLLGPSGTLEATAVEMLFLPVAGGPDMGTIKVLTNPQGEFSFQNIRPGKGTGILRFRAPGYGIQALPVNGNQQPWPGDVYLTYSRWASGRVRDQNGQAVAAARVMVGVPITGTNGSRVLWNDSGKSVSNGSFSARDLPVDQTVYILVDHGDYAPVMAQSLIFGARGPIPTVNFHLVPGLKLFGMAQRRNGKPAPRVQLTWEKVAAGGARIKRSAISGDQGKFTLQGLPHKGRALKLWVTSPRGRRSQVYPRNTKKGLVFRLPW